MRPEYISERARSANEGSGTAGRALVEPLACFLGGEDIAGHRVLTNELFHELNRDWAQLRDHI